MDDGQPVPASLTYLWESTDPNVTFTDATALSTTASFAAQGSYELQLTVSDGELSASDTYTVFVLPAPNQAPVVDAGLDQTHDFGGGTLTLAGSATDDGLPSGQTLTTTWTQLSGPVGAVIADPTALQTTVSIEFPGTYLFELVANDGLLTAADQVTLEVDESPIVSLPAPSDGTFYQPTDNVFFQANAQDRDGTLTSVEFFINDSKIGDGILVPNSISYRLTLPANTFTINTPLHVTARATDDEGNVTESTEPITISVLNDPGIDNVVEITSPAVDSEVKAPTDVIGTITDPLLRSYKLQYRFVDPSSPANDETSWITFGSGTSEVTNGALGTFDPTMLLNGVYELRIVSTDLFSRETIAGPLPIIVDSRMKIGHFSLTFEDLTVPLSGYPIRIIRSYDSRDPRIGDFGRGWTLSVKDMRVSKNRNLGTNYEFILYQDPTKTGNERILSTSYSLRPRGRRIVTIHTPSDQVLQFEMKVTPEQIQFAPQSFTGVLLEFEPLGDTTGILEAFGDDGVIRRSLFVAGAVGTPESPGTAFLYELVLSADPVFNPTKFKYTSLEGDTIVLDEIDGLESMTDRNGNSIHFNQTGIDHSSDESVAFTRDSQGRITQITDPAGHVLRYDYDTNGRLSLFTNRTDDESQFHYENSAYPFYLTRVVNPLGYDGIRTEYGEDGRLLRKIDAEGNDIRFTRDIPNRVETVTDRLGHSTTFEYDEDGNVVRGTDALGNVTLFSFDDRDREISRTDALGNVWGRTYDDDDNVTSQTDPLGHTRRYLYSSTRRPVAMTDANGFIANFTYDSRGNLDSLTDGEGNLTTFTYDTAGNQTGVTDAVGTTTSMTYDSRGNRLSETVKDISGSTLREMTYAYDDNGNQVSMTLKRTLSGGATEFLTTSYEYDDESRRMKTIYPDNTFTQTVYDGLGRVVQQIDELGRLTQMDYDARGNLILTTYPDLTTDSATYDLENRRKTDTDRLNRTTTFEYDKLGRLTKTIYPDSSFTETLYDANGRVVMTKDELGHPTMFEYDRLGRQTKTINALSQETTTVYDAAGRVTSVIDRRGNTTGFAYDRADRQTSVIFDDGTTNQTVYDSIGRRIVAIDQEGKTTRYQYDGLNRLTKVIDALEQETSFAYEETGRMILQTDAELRSTKYAYDNRGRRIRRELPQGEFETNSYDPVGNMLTRTDFNGQTTTYTYDLLNRLKTKAADSAHPSRLLNHARVRLEYDYDDLGLRVTANAFNDSGTLLWGETFGYDNRNRLTSKGSPLGTLSYTYDDAGNLTSTTSSNAGGTENTYTYDALNRLETVVSPISTNPTSYSYDANGNLATVSTSNGVTHTYSYDTLNRLNDLTITNGSTTQVLQSYAYALNAVGHRTGIEEASGRISNYTYDDTYKLLSESVTGSLSGVNGQGTWTYDKVGNRLTQTTNLFGLDNQTFTYTANDRLGQDTYNANGNTVQSDSGTLPANDQYDFEDKLIRRTKSDGTIIDLLYNCDGDRVQKTVLSASDAFIDTYHVDQNNHSGFAQVVEESNTQNGSILSNIRYLYGHDRISQSDGGLTHYYMYDGAGSVRGLTDNGGSLTDTFEYDAWGNLIARTGTTPNLYLYNGEQYDGDLEHYYLRARNFIPSTGRFWSQDTFEGIQTEPLSLHKYLYVHGDPVNRIDPSGNMSLIEVGVTAIRAELALIGAVNFAREFAQFTHSMKDPKKSDAEKALIFGDLIFSNIEVFMPGLGLFGGGKIVHRTARVRRPPKGFCFVAGTEVATAKRLGGDRGT